jgi:hypothetical protein
MNSVLLLLLRAIGEPPEVFLCAKNTKITDKDGLSVSISDKDGLKSSVTDKDGLFATIEDIC